MVVLYFLHRWDSWLYYFSIEVQVKLRSCTPLIRLWVKQQIRSSLSTCRTSAWCSLFLGFKTLWRQFCWESLSKLPSRHGCTQFWIDPARYCFRLRKSIWILRLLFFSKWNQKPDSLLLHISNFWKNNQVFRSHCFVESFHCVIQDFVSRYFKFRIHQEMLTGTQLFSQPVILNIYHYMFHITSLVLDPICIPCWVSLRWRKA